MPATKNKKVDTEDDTSTYPELLKNYLVAWNARGSACTDFIVTVSRQFNEMLRNELKEGPPDDFRFMQRVNELHYKIKLALGSDNPMELHYKKLIQLLNMEDEELLLEMKMREIRRIDKFDTRKWMQRATKRRSRRQWL